jgi:hypothetical protein
LSTLATHFDSCGGLESFSSLPDRSEQALTGKEPARKSAARTSNATWHQHFMAVALKAPSL